MHRTTIGTVLLLLLVPALALGQTKITFNIDMRPQIEDSTFIPAIHSIKLAGNQLPFSKTRKIKMRDRAPVDSIYSATVYFPSIVNDTFLEYNFLIKTPGGKVIQEQKVRLLQLEKQRESIPPSFFGKFGY